MKKKLLWGLGVFAAVALLIIRFSQGDTSPNLTYVEPEGKPEASVLVVVLHAFTRSRDDMNDVKEVIRSVYPNADISVPNYNTSTFSNASLTGTAAQLNDRIQELIDRKRESGGDYERIILVGHSIGALLARKVYLYSLGGSPDHPLGKRGNLPRSWSEKVTRIILLAGMNRGWSKDNIKGFDRFLVTLGEAISKITGRGRMVMSVKRGAPFVANLKLEWIRLVNSGRSMPQVIQLLGDDDTLSPEEDHHELLASPHFVYIPVLGTRHANIVDLLAPENTNVSPEADPEYSIRERRKTAFITALTEDIETLRQAYGYNSRYLDEVDPSRRSVEHVVFVMHGIRDHGEWVEGLARELEKADSGIRTITSKYGYFPMARFLLFSDREKNVQWFVDQYTEAVSLFPSSKKFSFIGHSNGTYLLASALENYSAVNFDRVYFAGSVVRTDFPWREYVPERVGIVRNDLAAHDWVVAWFPKLFQIIRKQFDLNESGFFNLGSAGFDGFQSDRVNKLQGKVTGGHSAALAHRASIVSYIVNGSVDTLTLDEQAANLGSSMIGFFSNIAWLVWVVLAGLIVLGAYLLARIEAVKRFGKVKAYLAYGLFLWALIYTV